MSDDVGEMDMGVEVTKGVAAKFTMAVLGFVGTIVFARLLGPTSFGGYYLLLSLVQLVDRPVGGWTEASKKRLSEVVSDDREVIGAQLLFNAVLLVVAVVGAIAFSGPLEGYTGLEASTVLFVVLFASLIFFYPFNQFLTARGWIGRQTWIDTFRSLVTLGFQLALVLGGLGAAGMAYGLAGASIVCVPLSQYYLKVWPAMPTSETVRDVWSYARHSIPAYFVGKAYDRFDVLLLGLLLTPAAAGYYEVAAKLTLPAMFVATVASSGLMPKVSNLHSKGERVTTDVVNTLAFVSILAIPLFFGSLALAEKIVVTAYGADFRQAAPLLVGLAMYRVVRSQSSPLQSTINGLDRPDLNFRISALTLAFNVVTGTVLVWILRDPIGVIIATITAELLRYMAAAYVVKTELPGIELLPTLFRHQFVAGAVMFGAVLLLERTVTVASWLKLGAVVGMGAAVYFLALAGLNSQFQRTSRSILRSFLRSM